MGDAARQQAMGGREWAMLLALAALWGGSFFFFKVLVAELPPLTVVLGRVGLAAAILNLWLLLRRDPMPGSPRLWGRFALMGLLNNVVPFTLIVYGETRIASGLASILNATTPIFTVVAAHFLTASEKLTPAKMAGCCGSGLGERLREVGENVVDMLDPHREPDIAVGDAGAQPVLGRKLGMRGRGGVDGEAAHVAEIRDVVEQLQRVDESLAGVDPAVELEPHQPAIAAVEVGVGPPQILAALEARVDHPVDLGMDGEELGHRLGIGDMRLHPQRQGLDPLDELEGVERADRRSHVAQQGHTGLQDIGDRPQRLHSLGPDRTAVTGIGLVQQRKRVA